MNHAYLFATMSLVARIAIGAASLAQNQALDKFPAVRAVLLIACALLAVALAKGAQQDREKAASEQIQIPAGKENLPAEQVFKNIEILKSEPASRLPGMMKALNRMLGVECTHCHVAGAWEKEEPEAKRTARLMFKVIGNVSQKYIGAKNEVNCWTCHHGGPKPSSGGAEIGAAMTRLPAERQQVIANLNNLGEDKPAEQVFQSIQVLKGLSVERMVPGNGCFHRRAWRGLLSLPRRRPVGRRPSGEGDHTGNAAHGPGHQSAAL